MSKPLMREEKGCIVCHFAWNNAQEERELPPRAHQPCRLEAVEVGQGRWKEGVKGGMVVKENISV